MSPSNAPKLSLCIPTYNRAGHLADCLNSIVENARHGLSFEVCVSDNGSSDRTPEVIASFSGRLPLKARRNEKNLGVARNILDAVRMAEGEFAWLLGDDDRLKPHALQRLAAVLDENPDADHVFVNSTSLPEGTPFSPWAESGRVKFLDLIDPRVSFDFLVGMFLSVFRRKNWLEGLCALDEEKVQDPRTFAHLDNTCPHVKVFAKGLARSQSHLCAEPLTDNIKGAREWAPLYPLVKSVRLVEALEEYRKNGLPWLQYLRCRNFALNTFLPDLANMFLHKDRSGYAYISPLRLVLANCLFPNFYLSPLYYAARKLARPRPA